MHALVIVYTMLKVYIKMAMSMEVEIIRLRCVLSQDVNRMPYALYLLV